MAKLVEAINPGDIRKSREVSKLHDLELINKVVSTINNRLEYLEEGRDLVFSFTGEGFPFTILEAVGDMFDSVGWDVTVYGQDRSRDTGLKISWKAPENVDSLSRKEREKWKKIQSDK